MRIKSNFKDFYDKIQGYVSSTDVFFTRLWCESNIKTQTSNDRRSEPFVIGFCGWMYYGLRVRQYKKVKEVEHGRIVNREVAIYSYHWNMDSYRQDIRIFSKYEEQQIAANFKVVQDHEPFIKDNSPIILDESGIRICCPLDSRNRKVYTCGPSWDKQPVPTLMDYDFDQVLTPQDAYCQLCDYVSGFLASEHKTVPEMSDKIKRDSHGFDKNSFRRRQ